MKDKVNFYLRYSIIELPESTEFTYLLYKQTVDDAKILDSETKFFSKENSLSKILKIIIKISKKYKELNIINDSI